MGKIIIYTTAFCPYCIQAKSLLKRRGISYEEILFDREDDTQWSALYEKSKMRTVPQIFSGERLIGGYAELAELDRKDSLESLKD